MRTYGRTHVGMVRKNNEDCFVLSLKGQNFCAVADGMGGHLAGEVASRIAIDQLVMHLAIAGEPSEEAFVEAVDYANKSVFDEAHIDESKHGMGTTLTALWCGVKIAYFAQVGDSRGYLLRDGELTQITTDHTLVEELVSSGVITPQEALTHPQRHFVTRALGSSFFVKTDIIEMTIMPGDAWMMCSDGMSNHVSTEEMGEILCREGTWDERLHALIALALERGGLDNITVVIAVDEEVGAT